MSEESKRSSPVANVYFLMSVGKKTWVIPLCLKKGNLFLTIPVWWLDVYNMRTMRSWVLRISLFSLYFCLYPATCGDFIRCCRNFLVIYTIVVFVVVCFLLILSWWSTFGLGKIASMLSSDTSGHLRCLVLIAHLLTYCGWVCTLGMLSSRLFTNHFSCSSGYWPNALADW
jgi:hypothetical protein